MKLLNKIRNNIRNKNNKRSERKIIMQVFSEEYLNQLKERLLLINLALGKIQTRSHEYVSEFSAIHVSNAMQELMTQKIVISAQIEAVDSHLRD